MKNKVSDNTGSAWPVAYRWAAVGTLIIYTAVGTETVTFAQSNNQSPAQAGTAQTLTVRKFDIAPGPLDTVLAVFQDATTLKIVIANDAIGNIASPGVSGIYPREQALRILLTGTGVRYRFTTGGTVTLELHGADSSINVIERTATVTSPKFTEPLRNTPQSISVVSKETMQDQGTTTLRDALRNVAGVSIAAGEGGSQGDNLTIRGFTARNDIFSDGMRDFGSYYRDPFNLEEVEVLKGPSSVAFGRGTTGGVVNQSSKTPNLAPRIGGSFNFGSDSTRRAALDLNQPLESLAKGTAFRLNVMGHDSTVAGRPIAENRRFGIAPSIAFGLGTPTRVTLSYMRQTADDTPDYGIPWLFNGAAPVSRKSYYGFRDANFLKTNADISTVKVEHDISSSITIRNQTRYSFYTRNVQITEPRVAGTPTLSTPLSVLTVTRNQLTSNSAESFFQNQTDLTARFHTGFLRHAVVTGIEAGREASNPRRPTTTNVPTTSLLNPDTSQLYSATVVPATNVHSKAISVGAYLIDTVKLGEYWEATGGVRWDQFDADYSQSIAPVSAFTRMDRMTSYRGSLVFKPTSYGSIYGGLGTSFNPSAESLALSSATANVEPEKNKNYELGTKWDLAGGRLTLRSSLFRTDKTNAREPDPNNPLLNVLAGSQRVDGFEFETSGHVTDRWQVLGSYALLDSELLSSKFYPTAVGSRLANVPKHTFNFWNSYALPWRGMAVGGGSQFVGSRAASATVPLDPTTGLLKQVPGYWVFNAMAKYPLNNKMDLQLNGYNLANRYYYDQLHPGHIVLGPGRSVLLGINFRF